MFGIVATLKRHAFLALTGYILYFYSEKVFWGHFRPGELKLSEFIFTWLAYSLLAFVFLTVVRCFRVKDLHALFLCGGLFGWVAEGIVVQTMYENFPINISCTGLSWHALFSIMVGWYWLRRSLIAGELGKTVKLCTWMGVFWGLWSVFWWTEDKQVTPLLDYCVYALSTTVLLIAAYWLYDCYRGWLFQPARWEMITVSLILLFLFFFVTVPKVPLALGIFPAAVVPTVLLLLRYRNSIDRSTVKAKIESRDPSVINGLAESGERSYDDCLDDVLAGSMRGCDAACIFVMPLVAIAIYWLLLVSGIRQPFTGWVVYLATTICGFLGYILAAVKILRGTARSASGSCTNSPEAS